MPLTTQEQELYDTAREALPSFLFQDGMQQELIGAFAVIMGTARVQLDAWLTQAYILTSTGMWLDQHAIDRSQHREPSESDAALRARVRTFADAVTHPALVTACNNVLVAAGISTSIGIYEERINHGYFVSATYPSQQAYFSRGYRFGKSATAALIVIIPYGASSGTIASIDQTILLLKAAGVPYTLETRTDAPRVMVSVTPPGATTVHAGSTVTFTANVLNEDGTTPANNTVTWQVNGVTGGNSTVGTISGAGVYTPPATTPDPPDVTITAVSNQDSSRSAFARLKVT